MPIPPITTGGSTSFHDRPAKKITDKPAASTSNEVPRSGCFMISPTGIASNSPAATKSRGRSVPSRF
ncbi:hypothetical protein D3C71_1752850 [compost metagenome]